MFQLLDDFYTQAIRIDLIAASQLAKLNPENTKYRDAAKRGAFVVTVLQGEVYESVYTSLLEKIFETFAEAKSFYDRLGAEHPDATCYDFTVPGAPGAAADGNP